MPQPKLRSRKGGAAIPLDDADRRLMNLLQSSFPLEPEPFALLAAEAEMELEEVLTRTRRLLDERIIREITPIFDTRALGYESMLVAAKVDAENPQRAAADRQLPPRRLAQLPAHARLQPLVHDRHPARLRSWGWRAPSSALMELTGAESMRELPTLTLFKINMNLEMEGGTEALAVQRPRPRRRGSWRPSPTTRATSP